MKLDKYYIPRNYFAIPGVLKTVGKLNGYDAIDIIADKVCSILDFGKAEMLRKTNLAENVRIRQLTIWCVSKKTSCTLVQIGKYFDKDHCTVLFSVRKIDGLIKMKTIEGLNAEELLSQL